MYPGSEEWLMAVSIVPDPCFQGRRIGSTWRHSTVTPVVTLAVTSYIGSVWRHSAQHVSSPIGGCISGCTSERSASFTGSGYASTRTPSPRTSRGGYMGCVSGYTRTRQCLCPSLRASMHSFLLPLLSARCPSCFKRSSRASSDASVDW